MQTYRFVLGIIESFDTFFTCPLYLPVWSAHPSVGTTLTIGAEVSQEGKRVLVNHAKPDQSKLFLEDFFRDKITNEPGPPMLKPWRGHSQ